MRAEKENVKTRKKAQIVNDIVYHLYRILGINIIIKYLYSDTYDAPDPGSVS